jgi:hypothetical protein
MSIIGKARLGGQTYELRHHIAGYLWWLGDAAAIETAYPTPAEAIDALWEHLGLRAAPEGWWEPAEGVDVDISAAKRPRTVTERDERLGRELEERLRENGLDITYRQQRGHYVDEPELALAYQLAEALVLEAHAERLLEQLATEHGLECEMAPPGAPGEGWDIVDTGAPTSAPGELIVLATSSTPLEAVEELQRDLLADLSAYSDEQLLRELLDRAKGRAG